MDYQIEIKRKAIKDMKTFPVKDRERILNGIERLKADLDGDVKRLTDSNPRYRLRVGTYRVLFNIEGERVVVYRVKPRGEAYR